MSNAVAISEVIPAILPNHSLTSKEVRSQVHLIQEVMKEVMKENEHYGKIPGCGNKPTLLKSGAEKLAHTFRFAPKYEEISGSKEGDDLIIYKIRCDLVHIPTGNFVGSGLGACNSREKKYQKQQPWDVQNTLYKMACKRALVAAVLNATAASDIFTQDIEDMEPESFQSQKQVQHTQNNSQSREISSDVISDAQRKRLYAIYKGAGVTDDQMRDYLMREYKIDASKDIKRSDYEAICEWAANNAERDL